MAVLDIDRQTLLKRLDRIKHELVKIERMEFGPSELLGDEDIQDMIDRRMQLAIEAAIDVAVMLVAAMQLPRKDEAAEVFRLLEREKVISKGMGEKMAKATGLRNVLVHEYMDIDYTKAYGGEEKQNKIKDLKKFCAEVVGILEKE